MTNVPSVRGHGQPGSGGSSSAAAAAGWRAVRPELLITCIMVIATAVAAFCYAGVAAAFATVTVWAVVILALLRVLVPATAAGYDSRDDHRQEASPASYIGFWRKRGVLVDASTSIARYDADLRPTLQHLLAARLAERHGISLYQDPEAARRLLLAGQPDDAMWFWLDPRRPAEQRWTRQGIPQRTLTEIIDRLEQL